ncbi:hypothetical protein N0V90_004354 [Kalmusia sp. IMI 367209]|nr:hypothetical protein N0V90_004354 [Kalmusia sp. IMI 367209]
MASIYKQRILSGRTFRLLFIHPAQHYEQQLQCSCLPFAIDDAPSFEALSYVWGRPTPAVEVLCDGEPISIQPELASALSRLRLQQHTRIVWADAICINQNDVEERNNQVSLMGSIYPSATRVIVWLGPADPEHTETALEVIEIIGAACMFKQYARKIVSSDEKIRDLFDRIIKSLTPAICACLGELFKRPWFSRIWCVQEIRLARDALVLCGEYEVTWERFALAVAWMTDRTFPPVVIERLDGLLESIDIGPASIMCDNMANNLLGILHSCCEFQSTDPKDKVYGLLSLVHPRAEVEGIDVDYNKSIGAVFADTVLANIKVHSKLSAFAFVSHPPGYDGTAGYRSWAPRWDNYEPAFVFGYPEELSPWNASGHALVSLADETDPTPEALHLKGVLYDKVLEVCQIMDFNLEDKYWDFSIADEKGQESECAAGGNTEDIQIIAAMDIESGAQANDTHPFLEMYNKTCDDPYAQDRKILLARTLTAGTYYDKYLEDLDAATRDKYLPAFERVMHRLAQLDCDGTEGKFGHDDDSKTFELDAYRHVRQRRMFWTSKGSLGLGPQCMCVDDIVVILYGGNMPYVLRPRGDRFLFMGPAYIDNIMHGEVIDDLRAGKMQEQTFCLI